MKTLILAIILIPISLWPQRDSTIINSPTQTAAWNQRCGDIVKKIDKFKETIYFYTPLKYCVGFTKSIRLKDTFYYLSLTAKGSSVVYGEKGAIILFEDSSKLSFPDAKIDVDYVNSDYGPDYLYTVFIPLNEYEMIQFMKSPITDFQLYIFDVTIREKEGKKYQNYANCITES